MEGVALNTITALLEWRLKEDKNEVRLQKEMAWRQKSRTDWLKCGNRNTKIFLHSSEEEEIRLMHRETNREFGLRMKRSLRSWLVDSVQIGLLRTQIKEESLSRSSSPA